MKIKLKKMEHGLKIKSSGSGLKIKKSVAPVPRTPEEPDIEDMGGRRIDVKRMIESAYARVRDECVKKLGTEINKAWEDYRVTLRAMVTRMVQEGFSDAYKDKVNAFVSKAEMLVTPVDVGIKDIEKVAGDGWHIVEIVSTGTTYHHRKPGIYWQRFKGRGVFAKPEVKKDKERSTDKVLKFKLKFAKKGD